MRKRVVIWPGRENRQMWKYATRIKGIGRDQITYPTVVMVTTAHQNPSQAPWTNVVENSDEKKTYSYEETNQLKTDYHAIKFSAVTF